MADISRDEGRISSTCDGALKKREGTRHISVCQRKETNYGKEGHEEGI